MYQFATVALLGLVVLKLTDLLVELVPAVARFRTLTTFVLAVVGVVALDYSVLEGFGISVRDAEMGTWVTGLIVGSLASAWQAALGWLRSTERLTPGTGSAERPRIAA
jgi:hypothetical protein